MSLQNLYTQPSISAIAPDATIFIDQGKGRKRTITLKTISDSGVESEIESDLMLYVTSISTSKGVDRVPGEASISLRAPRYMMNKTFGDLKGAFSTMQEIEIYMKGRFLLSNEPQYYPAFWGVISNVSNSEPAGDLVSVTLSCQDMMRWLAITKVNVQPSAINSSITPVSIAIPVPGSQINSKNSANAFGTIYVGVSVAGIIRDLFNLSTSEGFTQSQDIPSGGTIVKNLSEVVVTQRNETYREETELISMWHDKFANMATALYIYGYAGENPKQTPLKIPDIMLDMDTYGYIYGSKPMTTSDGQTLQVPFLPMSTMFPFNAEAFNVAGPPAFVANFQNRLDVATEAKNQIQLEFFQDTDGTIVLKPQFYNMDTSSNPIYVIEDIDIVNFNEIEDESQVITRIDVIGTYANGMPASDSGSAVYGFAIDFDKMGKYGLRVSQLNTNFILSSDDAILFAQRELARHNTLVTNGSLMIQGRPELKLGYPVYLPGKNMFCYVTGIEHSFTFGGSFDTTLTVTAFRKLRYDAEGNLLKNLLVNVNGTDSSQTDAAGSDSQINSTNALTNLTKLCDSQSSFKVQRPNYRLKSLDDILRYQGTFTFVKDSPSLTYDPRQYQQVTDDEGYELIGNGYPFAKDLVLTEDLQIAVKSSSYSDSANIASNMTVASSTGVTSTIRYQQPLTLDQIQNVELVKTTQNIAKIALNMVPPNTSSNTGNTTP